MFLEPIDDICNNPCRYVSSMKKLIAKNPADPRNDLKDLLKAAQWRLEKMEAPSRGLKAKHINMIQCCGYRTKLTSQWMIRDDSSARYDQMCGLFLVPQFFVLCFVCVLPPLPAFALPMSWGTNDILAQMVASVRMVQDEQVVDMRCGYYNFLTTPEQ